MMKVLRVITSMNPKSGGPCQGIRNSVPAMQTLGIETEVVCFDDSEVSYDDDFVIHTIGPAKGPYRYCGAFEGWMKKNIVNYDVVIIHGLWLYNSYGTFKVWKQLRKKQRVPKLFVMPHGMLDPYFQKAKERRFKAIRNLFFWHLVEAKVVNGADGVLFTCEQELLLAKTTFKGYVPKREINIGYGVKQPPKRLESMKAAFIKAVPKWNGKPFWLFLSRIHSKKGVDLLIKAYLSLEKKHETLPQLMIAGPALNPDYGREMEAMAAGSENIIFTGMLSGEAKWGAFYEAEAFVLPSHQENFGIAVAEALACGTPVLISDKINIWREIQDKEAGLVMPDDQEGCNQLLSIWQNYSKIQKQDVAEKAYDCYKTHYDVLEVAKQFESKIGV